MSFKVLSKEEYEALDTRSQVKYEIELEAYRKAEQERAIKEAVDAQLEAVKAESAKSVEAMKAEFQAEIEKAKQEAKEEAEKLQAKLKEQGIGTPREERIKTMEEYIMAKFSTEEGEALLKNFMRDKKSLNTDIEGTEKAFLKPTSNGGYVSPELAGIYGAGHDTLRARNVLRVLQTSSDLIKFLQLTPDPDADGYDYVAEGATKPDLAYLSQVKQVAIKKIAGLLDVSDESMDDLVGFRAFLASELPLAYLDFEDQYIFKHTTDGIYTQAEAWVPNGTVDASSNAWDKIISAATQVRLNKRNPTAVFVSPIGYQELLINKDLENAYTYPIVMDSNGVLRVGGLPIYATNVLEGGEFLVGDFATGAALWQRQGMTVAYSDEHKDNFATNIVTIRIEARIAVTVYKTDAFVKGDLLSTT